MSEHGVKKLIFSSSSTVYGDPQFLPLTEEHPTGQNCANPYGRTKFLVEEILKDLCKSDKVCHVFVIVHLAKNLTLIFRDSFEKCFLLYRIGAFIR